MPVLSYVREFVLSWGEKHFSTGLAIGNIIWINLQMYMVFMRKLRDDVENRQPCLGLRSRHFNLNSNLEVSHAVTFRIETYIWSDSNVRTDHTKINCHHLFTFMSLQTVIIAHKCSSKKLYKVLSVLFTASTLEFISLWGKKSEFWVYISQFWMYISYMLYWMYILNNSYIVYMCVCLCLCLCVCVYQVLSLSTALSLPFWEC